MALGIVAIGGGIAAAQTLTMGVGSPVSSLDPHNHQLRSDSEVSQALFDTPSNRIRYSNAEMDAPLGQAEGELDDTRREALLQQASRVVIDDHAILPLYLQNAIWAMRRSLTYGARSDERNDPAGVRPEAR